MPLITTETVSPLKCSRYRYSNEPWTSICPMSWVVRNLIQASRGAEKAGYKLTRTTTSSNYTIEAGIVIVFLNKFSVRRHPRSFIRLLLQRESRLIHFVHGVKRTPKSGCAPSWRPPGTEPNALFSFYHHHHAKLSRMNTQ
jgi:hypothetical protein